MRTVRLGQLLLLLATTATAPACGGPKPAEVAPAAGANGQPTAPRTGVLLEQQGSLAAPDLAFAQRFADDYEIPVQAGVRMVVRVDGGSLDTTLQVTTPDGHIHSNDDFAGSTQVSQVEFMNAQAGVLKIRVSTYAQNASGEYRLRAEAFDAAVPSPTSPTSPSRPTVLLALGATVSGTIEAGDFASREGTRSDTYMLQGGQPQAATLTLSAPTGATLSVLTPDGQSNAAATDASGQARLTFSLAAPGNYTVSVSERTAGQGGTYNLQLGQASSGQPAIAESERRHHRGLGSVRATGALSMGAQTVGTLSPATRLTSGEPVAGFTLQVGQATDAQIDLEADFDAYLILVSPTGRVIEDDDGGEGYNARVNTQLSEPGAWTVLASSYRPDASGAFRLSVRTPQPDATTAAATSAPATDLNVTREGTLQSGDASASRGGLEDVYTFQWPAGRTVEINLNSTQFDPLLVVETPSGAAQVNDDVQQGNLNSALRLTLSEAGRYTVRVGQYANGQTGAYTLQIRESSGGGAPNEGPSTPTAVASGPIQGQLAAGDQQVQGIFVDTHHLDLPAGRVRIDLMGNFDTVLEVIGPDGVRMSDDDGGEGNNARLEFDSSGGRYTVYARAYAPNITGAYTLTVGGAGGGGGNTTPTAPAAPAVVDGRLAPPANQAVGGRFASIHAQRFAAGQRVRVAVSSSEFDTQLFVKAPSGRVAHNDDVQQGNTNSALELVADEAGEWQVIVTSYRVGEQGSFRLEIAHLGAGGGGGGGAGGGGVVSGGGGPRVFGIFVGIDDYGGHGNLQECANDAIKLAQELREAGVQAADQQVVLTDGQASPEAVRNAFRQLAGRMTREDQFIFFYSGHGGQTDPGSRDQREIDGRDEYLAFPRGQISDDEMAQLYDLLPSRLAVLALDSCHSGGFAKDVITRPGRMGYFSSEEDLTSSTAGAFQAGGYLSLFLRQGIRGGADSAPQDGRVTAGELSHYLFNQFGRHVTDVQSMGHGGRAFQHLVVDRGAVTVDTVLFALR